MLFQPFMNGLVVFAAKDLVFAVPILTLAIVLRLDRPLRREWLLYALLTLPLILIASRIAGALYFDSRPFVVGSFVPLVAHAPDNGFPSDHALFASALAVLIFPYRRWTGALLFLLAGLIGFARVAAGVHHGIDILASLAISAGIGFFAFRFLLPPFKKSLSGVLHRRA